MKWDWRERVMAVVLWTWAVGPIVGVVGAGIADRRSATTTEVWPDEVCEFCGLAGSAMVAGCAGREE